VRLLPDDEQVWHSIQAFSLPMEMSLDYPSSPGRSL